jgi:RNA polymerase sigma-70 factor, ECF subfamily
MDADMTGETALFRTFYDANHARVHGLLARMAGAQEADDLTQTVFVKAAAALPQFRGDAQPSTWLYRIAANVASDWLRSRAAHEARLTRPLPEESAGEAGQPAAAVADPQPSPEQRLARKDMQGCIRDEIARLPAASRDVLMLGELGGLSDEDLAQTLEITLANAKVRLHRARTQLKAAIAARCEFYRTELSCAPAQPSCCPPATPASDRL